MTNHVNRQILLFTDLDGCLLNKTDYRYDEARPVLERLASAKIPVVLCSSKTQSEMSALQHELSLTQFPMTCENGGVIVWNDLRPGESTILGRNRDEILDVLSRLKSEFSFRSFRDLGVEGVMATTDLPRVKAEAALNRQSTEPLLWDDAPEKIAAFREHLQAAELTLTEGGRFWHVAAKTTKGLAMQQVADEFAAATTRPNALIAIGDSPIDQSMLDIADVPIGIPQPTGEWKISVPKPQGIQADHPGAKGWATAVETALARMSHE